MSTDWMNHAPPLEPTKMSKHRGHKRWDRTGAGRKTLKKEDRTPAGWNSRRTIDLLLTISLRDFNFIVDS
jgi:hypothetical protein